MFDSKKRKALGLLLVVVILFTGAVGGFFFHKVQANENNLSKSEVQELNNFQKLFLILDIIKKHYVEEPEDNDLLTGAIKGMLNSLDDPYTTYLPPERYEDMKEGFSGEYGGIGIIITMKNDQLTVVSPFKGTPGDKAGLQGGDVIKEVNGKATAEMTMNKAVSIMKGEPGTDVTLTIKREIEKDEGEGTKKEFEEFKVDITRAKIEIPFISAEMKEDNIGYIHLSQFIENVGDEVKDEIDKLSREGAKAFILDLRSNPGGLLREATRVASCFLDEGTVVSVKGRNGKEEVKTVVNDIKSVDVPLVVLVNGESASASEIIAGAVQDKDRGLIVGTQTFGKGVVQSVLPLSDGSAVKLTTARYYTPEGRFINHKGIKPDKIVELNTDNEEDEQLQEAINILKEELKK